MTGGDEPRPEAEGAEPPAAASTAQAISAVRWTLFGTLLQRVITFGAVALLARLLSTTEYGAYRQLLSVHLVIFVVLPLGFDQLYIREVRLRDHLARLLAAALGISACLFACIALVGHWLISGAMDFGPWSGMLWLAPAVIAVQAWKLFYKTDLAARLDYRRIGLGEAVYAAVSGLGAVGLALLWPSAWSLYIAFAAAELAELLWLGRGHTVKLPPLRASLTDFRRDATRWKRFGVYHCGMQVLNAIGGNAPVIILGSTLSKTSAAAFSMANFLVTVPIYLLIGALHRVAYSALAGRTREQLTSAVLQMLALSGAFIVPVLIWVAVMAEPLVHLALGENWIPSTAPVARWLALYCVFVALFSPVSSLDLLLDRPDYGFWWNVVATPLRVIAVIAGLKYGVMHAVVAYAVTSAVVWVAWGMLLAHLLGQGQARFHGAWFRFVPLWAGLAVLLWGTLYLARESASSLVNHPVSLILLSAAPAALYTGWLAFAAPSVFRFGLRIARREKNSAGAAPQ